MRPSLILVLCPALAFAGCTNAGALRTTGAGALGHRGNARDSAPARDSFTGTIVSGTGAFSRARGRVRVNLHPRGSGRARQTRVVVIGQCRASSRRCIELSGAVSGMLSPAGPRLPDVGHGFSLSGTGRVAPLGHVTLRGSVAGTGFIAHGHELMRIRLSSRSGTVTVQGISGPVRGFTTP